MKKKREPKKNYFANNPMTTGEISKELGVGLTNEFLVKKLKLKPLLETRITSYWDDIDLIKKKLAEYFAKISKA